ncbi:ferredoxin-type protein NapF [Litoribrevibacter euphylliae]|uniref:Ferredoxin-type protein NapF n=1 Tax=Litoribrevibacter euphylliae TaxID=1834034 RepID=A0ABV7HAM8_9GAMM
MDISRRSLFRGRISSGAKAPLEPIRMPWMIAMEDFTDLCSRCAKCVDQCPEGVIKKGDGGFPTVDFQKGECTFCAECVDVCPEPVFKATDEPPWHLTAVIAETANQVSVTFDGVCMAYQGVVCQSCKDACDVRAIQMKYLSSATPVPKIDVDACTGCGACVSVCPTNAIGIVEKAEESLSANGASTTNAQEAIKQQKGVKAKYAIT